MRPLVSVIVPVYKVEKYLPRCLDSLYRQSLKNIEILLIDDASPDQCRTICEQYAAKDLRFKVIQHTENRGLSAARNTGIRQATADHLMFVDSDDWVHENFCKEPYEFAVNNRADLVIFGYHQVSDKTVRYAQVKLAEVIASGFKTREEAINLTFTAYGCVAWNKLYRKSLFKSVCYPNDQLFEDIATTYKLVWNASRIYCMDKTLYYYFRHPGSITQKPRNRRFIKEQFKAYWQQCRDLSAWGFSSDQYKLFKTNMALSYCMQTPLDYSDPYYAISSNIIRNTNNNAIALSRKRKVLISIFQRSPELFDLICALCHKQVY